MARRFVYNMEAAWLVDAVGLIAPALVFRLIRLHNPRARWGHVLRTSHGKTRTCRATANPSLTTNENSDCY